MLGVKLKEYLTADERAEKTLKDVGVGTVKASYKKPRKERFSKARGAIRKGANLARKAGKLTGEAARTTRRAGAEARKEMRAAGREFGRSGPTRREKRFLQQDVFGKRKKKKKKKKKQKYIVRHGVAYPVKRKKKKKKQRRRGSGLNLNDVIGF